MDIILLITVAVLVIVALAIGYKMGYHDAKLEVQLRVEEIKKHLTDELEKGRNLKNGKHTKTTFHT